MKEFFNEAKEKYESIKAPSTLKSRIKSRFKTKRLWNSRVSGLVGVFMVASIVGLNLSPVFAKNLSEIPGMQAVVKILTGNKYRFDEKNYHAKIDVPEVTELGNEELQEKINIEVKQMAEKLIANFKEDAEDMENSGLGGHLSVESGYEILTDNNDVFAFDVWAVNVVGSSSTSHKFYNIDKKNKCLIELSDFIKNAEIKKRVNDYIRDEIARRQDYDNGIIYFEEDYKGISDNQGFYVNQDNNLVIVFEKY